MANSPTIAELQKLAEFLDLRAVEADAKADVHRKANELPDAQKEERRAKSGRHYAEVCRDAVTMLANKEKRGQFIPPTFQEVSAEMKKHGLPTSEASRFMGHYESNGWLVGRNGMKSWKAAVVNWREGYFEKRPAERPLPQPATLSKILSVGDPEGWAAFLKSIGEPYKGHRFMRDTVKEQFNQQRQ